MRNDVKNDQSEERIEIPRGGGQVTGEKQGGPKFFAGH